LVVEDNICVRSVTAEVLREAGYSVIEAANAAEAVAVFDAGTAVDLVFSDIEMRGSQMDGVGLARWVFRPEDRHEIEQKCDRPPQQRVTYPAAKHDNTVTNSN
jgi:CheY-like chemotaxis protein